MDDPALPEAVYTRVLHDLAQVNSVTLAAFCATFGAAFVFGAAYLLEKTRGAEGWTFEGLTVAFAPTPTTRESQNVVFIDASQEFERKGGLARERNGSAQ